MKTWLFKKFQFSSIKRDRWLDSVNQLSKADHQFLKKRELVFLIYRIVKYVLLAPISITRGVIHLVQLLREFEELHFSPLRKIHRGKGCVIDRQTWLVNGHNIFLGDFVKISAFSSIIAGNVSKIKIGTNTIIAPRVTIVALNHGMDPLAGPIRYQKWKESPIIIGDDVWIAANVVILPGSVIGSGSVIGAGAIINGDVPPMTITYCKNGQLISVPRE